MLKLKHYHPFGFEKEQAKKNECFPQCKMETELKDRKAFPIIIKRNKVYLVWSYFYILHFLNKMISFFPFPLLDFLAGLEGRQASWMGSFVVSLIQENDIRRTDMSF